MHTDCWYNPKTNQLLTNRTQAPEGFECLGSRKVAEAFTSVDSKYWPILWENRLGAMIRIKNFNSRLKHQLKKIGITENYDWR